jgi:hypothetical protein
VRFERGENGASIRVISACGGRAEWRVLVWLATTEGRDGDAERRARGTKRYRMGRRGVEDDGGRGDGGHGADEREAERFYAEGQEREEVRCITQRKGQRRTMQAACATSKQSRLRVVVPVPDRSWLRAEDSEALDTIAAGGEVITAARAMGSGCRGCWGHAYRVEDAPGARVNWGEWYVLETHLAREEAVKAEPATAVHVTVRERGVDHG